MIQELIIENFKGFKKYKIEFGHLNLLVGGNNSGKTTIFHALQTVFWCIEKTADTSSNTEVVFGKTQVSEIGAFPYFNLKDIFYHQKTREGGKPKRIKFRIKFQDVPELSFSIYPAFSRNLMVDGNKVKISKVDYEKITKNLKPVYVPSTIGITVKEELFRAISQERLISEGRQNEVLRNQIYRLKQNSPEEWIEFKEILSPIFQLEGIDVPFDENKDEWLSVLYNENDCEFDCISAGSGFLQLINLLVFVFLHESRVALLDEPDSHMHTDLQQISFDLLHTLSERRNIQLIIATHSPTFIDSAGLENVMVIDRDFETPLKTENVEELTHLLGDRGISLPPTKIIDTLRSRKVLFVEGNDADYEEFIKAIGIRFSPTFLSQIRGLTVFETEGATKKWPYDTIAAFEKLLGVSIKYVYVSDRDFSTDVQLAEKQKASLKFKNQKSHFLKRRNRESYLCDPKILSKLLIYKWNIKHEGKPIPDEFKEESIKNFFVEKAKEFEDNTRTTLLVQQEPYLRGPTEERTRKTGELNLFFRDNYTNLIIANQIPYTLADCKEMLKNFRTVIAEKYKISFRDKEILSQFEKEDIPEEIQKILVDITEMFSN
jgi:energy-coupling factor transporter ATP-binding protein EcfA2